MIEIRFHGRGGQGVVVASRLLAVAFFKEHKYVQSFGAFGMERRGAPVAAFTRIDDEPLRLRCAIYSPDHLVVLDRSLVDTGDITSDLKPGGWVVVNCQRLGKGMALPPGCRLATVDAGSIAAQHHLGPPTTPIVNTAILGAFSKATGLVSLEAILEAAREEIAVNPEGNLAAIREAYDKTRVK